jgi:hypothetical protein
MKQHFIENQYKMQPHMNANEGKWKKSTQAQRRTDGLTPDLVV